MRKKRDRKCFTCGKPSTGYKCRSCHHVKHVKGLALKNKRLRYKHACSVCGKKIGAGRKLCLEHNMAKVNKERNEKVRRLKVAREDMRLAIDNYICLLVEEEIRKVVRESGS